MNIFMNIIITRIEGKKRVKCLTITLFNPHKSLKKKTIMIAVFTASSFQFSFICYMNVNTVNIAMMYWIKEDYTLYGHYMDKSL